MFGSGSLVLELVVGMSLSEIGGVLGVVGVVGGVVGGLVGGVTGGVDTVRVVAVTGSVYVLEPIALMADTLKS